MFINLLSYLSTNLRTCSFTYRLAFMLALTFRLLSILLHSNCTSVQLHCLSFFLTYNNHASFQKPQHKVAANASFTLWLLRLSTHRILIVWLLSVSKNVYKE